MCSLFCLKFKRLGLSRYLSVATKTQRICASRGWTYTAGIQLPHESHLRLIWDKTLVCQVLVGRQRACALGKTCDKYGYSRVDSVYTALHKVTLKSETIFLFYCCHRRVELWKRSTFGPLHDWHLVKFLFCLFPPLIALFCLASRLGPHPKKHWQRLWGGTHTKESRKQLFGSERSVADLFFLLFYFLLYG